LGAPNKSSFIWSSIVEKNGKVGGWLVGRGSICQRKVG
jgi:hypothetical protein